MVGRHENILMRQFDICRLKDRSEQLVLLLQHDIAEELTTRIVAPLSDKPYRNLITQIRVPVEIDGKHFVVQLDRMAAIDRRAIGNVVGNLVSDEQRIKSALDLVFLGV